MKVINNTTILIIILLSFLILEYRNYLNRNETFENITNNIDNPDNPDYNINKKLIIKKTNKFRKVYSHENYTVYEPYPIDDFYPLGQYITFNGQKPLEPAMLVKSNDDHEEKPKDFVIVCSTEDDMPIWKPVSNKNFTCMGYIFSKNKPSVHRFLCVNKKYCKLTSLNNNIFSKKLNKSNNNFGYTIWNIRNNPHFICSSYNNENVPKNSVFEIVDSFIDVNDPIKIIKTKSYKHIWKYYNVETKKYINIWLPERMNDYYPIGYIGFSSNINPNNNIETTLVHKDHVKKPIDYGNQSIVDYTMEDTNDSNIKNNKISFWKPRAPEGYTCLSDVLVENHKEPYSNSLIYCVATEYLVPNGELKEIWNTVPDIENKLAIFTDDNNYIYTNYQYKPPQMKPLEIDEKLIHVEKDILDIKRGIIFVYEDNNKENSNNLNKEKIILENLSNKAGVPKTRFSNIVIHNNNTISFAIEPRPANSNQLSTYQIKNVFSKLIESENLNINDKKNNTIFKLKKIKILEPKKNDYISLDNNKFADKFN